MARVQVPQQDASDCGAACLASVAAWYGLKIPVSKIRLYASTGPEGTTLLGLVKAAENIGFEARGIKAREEALPECPLPAIAHLVRDDGLHHYVTLFKVKRKGFRVMDPADGKLKWINHQDFLRQWSGILMTLTPGHRFEPGDRKISFAKRVYRLLRPHKSLLVQALFGSALFTIAGLATAIFVQLLVDHVLADGNRNLLHLLGVSMLAVLLFRTYIGAFKSLFTIRAGQLIDARLLLGYYHHLLRLPQSFFDRMRVGEIISRLNDAVRIRAFINDALLHLSVQLFVFLFAFGLMFTTYWKLALFMLLMIPAYSITYLVVDRLNRKTQRRLMENSADLESQLVESVQSISTIKQFGLEKTMDTKSESRFIALLRSVYRSGINMLIATSSSEFISYLFTILVLWIGALYVMDGALTTGELLSFYTVTGYFTRPIQELLSLNQTIQDASIAGDRLFEIMDLDQESGLRENLLTLPDNGIDSITFQNVEFSYGPGRTVFDNLNLTIPGGRMTALVGESGSGKSTIAHLLQKLYPADSGEIRIGEFRLDQINTTSLRERIGVVPQNIHLFSGSILENIAPGDPEPNLTRIFELCRQIGMIDMIEQLPHGIENPVGEHGCTLSGGEKQRIAIARALYRDPELLILDEATSSLDSSAERQIQSLFESLISRGTTILLIAHRLSTVIKADQICLLREGKVLETGTHQELLDMNPDYRRLWQAQRGAIADA